MTYYIFCIKFHVLFVFTNYYIHKTYKFIYFYIIFFNGILTIGSNKLLYKLKHNSLILLIKHLDST
uniref:Uncharacterized protein n=1 Tax=Siphoviridae sp. ctr8v12 TaxID=2825685 RepID=A0A8S5QHM5_9CAUD|nr:MAG TPA: hypothetical protein [Siphoviridae sp. ctr8v12]